MRICPICKQSYTEEPALSRKDNKTEICSDCGMNEAMGALATHWKVEDEMDKDFQIKYGILDDKYKAWRTMQVENDADTDCGLAIVREDFTEFAKLDKEITFEEMLELEADWNRA